MELLRLLTEKGLDAREIAAHRADLCRGLELAHRLLDPEPEQLIGEIALFHAELVGAQVAECGGGLHNIFSCSKRMATFVRMGSFAAASFIASRADCSLMPSISKSTRPGFTTATHWSGRPSPLPLPVSGARLV